MKPTGPHTKRYVPETHYTYDDLPGYLQSRYRNGHGFIEVRPQLTRQSYLYAIQPRLYTERIREKRRTVFDEWMDEEEEIVVPITEKEKQRMRLAWCELQNAPTTELAEQQEAERRKLELYKKKKINRYIERYFLKTGLFLEARKAGVGLRWLLVK